MRKTLLAATAMLGLAGTAQAATLLADDFDGYGPTSILDFTGFDELEVRNGTVDYIATGNPWGITCAGGTGGCVDLNGSTGDVGLLFASLTFEAGQQYELSFDLSGSQRPGQGGANDTVWFGVLGLATDMATLNPSTPFQTYSLTFLGDGGTYDLFFKNGAPDSDNIGAILDNLRVAAVPLPAAGLLLLGALGVLGVARRRAA